MPHRFDPDLDHRRSIRLRDHDYARGATVFVTVCTYAREAIFGQIVDGTMRLNESGVIASTCWVALPAHFGGGVLDAYVIMPNHLHGLLVVGTAEQGLPGSGARRASPLQNRGPAAGSVGAIVGAFKSAAARQINASRGTPGASVWQRNYYEHVVRNDDDLRRIRLYVATNPAIWPDDDLFASARTP